MLYLKLNGVWVELSLVNKYSGLLLTVTLIGILMLKIELKV